MVRTIFDITEQLPVAIWIAFPNDKIQPIFTGRIDKIILDTRKFLLIHNKARGNYTKEEIIEWENNIRSLHITDNNQNYYVFNNFKETLSFTVSIDFCTGYINGFKIIEQSLN